MTTATTLTAPAPTTTPRGFGNLPCPKCGEEAVVTLRLDSFEEDDACKCMSCDAEFSLADVRDLIAKWSRVLAWLESAPMAE
jgi:transcription elongation factor Elf1